MKKYCYITTPIYYPNANLHLGHAYTTTLADVTARYKRDMGYEVVLLTGADEHGYKIEQMAIKAGINPQDFVDAQVLNFKLLWEALDINYQIFMRTTDAGHMRGVQKIFQQLQDKGHIYKGHYEGLYCNNCAEFLITNQIKRSGECKVCLKKPLALSEPSYFFRIAGQENYIKTLLEKTNPLLAPEIRAKELKNNFLKPGLTDFSIARENIQWGVAIPADEKFVIYVWFDAICNYITALNYKLDGLNNFNKYWGDDSEIIHFIGKEITRFHAIYWPAVLNYLEYRLPDQIVAHGWLIMKDAKMSKSLHNIVDPHLLIKRYSSDALRAFLVARASLNSDAAYSHRLFLEFYNNCLVNDIANLFSRFNGMVLKYYDGTLPTGINLKNNEIINKLENTVESFRRNMDTSNSHAAYLHIFSFIKYLNAEIEVHKPWLLNKNDPIRLGEFMISLYCSLVVIAKTLQPLLTKTSLIWLKNLGSSNVISLNDLTVSSILESQNTAFKIEKLPVTFGRLKVDQELKELNLSK